jgi:hypothetical protein
MLGKPLRKSFLASRLCASHHFFWFEGVGEILGMLGGMLGKSVRVCWVEKESPSRWEGGGHFAAKALQRYVFVWVGCEKPLRGLLYLCGMATLSVGYGAAKAVRVGVPRVGKAKRRWGRWEPTKPQKSVWA